MKKGYFAPVLVLLAVSAVLTAAEPIPKGSLILNEDNSHFFYFRSPDQMTESGLNAFIDQYADTAVTHLFLCPNASRANFTNPARDAIWAPNSEGKEPDGAWPQNCKLLEERGLDPYTYWIARAREKKISPWLSMRMNDLHSVDDTTNFMHSSFWVNHPEFWRVPNDTTGSWTNRALNFKHPEVRKHAADFIDVLFERYDFDGLELDWMRFGWHLTPGHESEEGRYITEITAFAHQRAKEWSVKRGHPIYLSVRVPATPEDAAGLGMDAVSWAKAGLIDLVVPTPFWETADFDIPVESWKQLLAGTNVTVVPGLEILVRAFPGVEARDGTAAQLRGFTISEKYRGAESIYLFNWMDIVHNPEQQHVYISTLKAGVSYPDILETEYEIPVTYHDTTAPGNGNHAQLPQNISTDTTARLVIPTGPVPAGNSKSGIVIGLQKNDGIDSISLTGTLNGVHGTAEEVDRTGIPSAYRAFFISFPSEAFQEGTNEFTISLTSGSPQKIIFAAARINVQE